MWYSIYSRHSRAAGWRAADCREGGFRMEERQFRSKIQWFTFCFSILVVWVHAANAELFLGRTGEAAALEHLQSLVGNGLGQFAVPGFFMISAYLFYRNFSWDKLERKLKSRFRSLVIPFLLWNGLYYLGYALASRVPGLTEIVGKGVIPLDPGTAIQAVVLYRYNAVFWYLYQLIWLVALTPVLYSLLKRKGTAALLLAAAAAWVWFERDVPFINEDSLLYYVSAACWAIYAPGTAEEAGGRRQLLEGAGVLAAGIACLLVQRHGGGIGFLVYGRLLIPMGVWRMVDKRLLPQARWWMKDTFFLYATHFAFVRLVNKTMARIFPGSALGAALLYALMPALCLGFALAGRAVLVRLAPPLWRLLTGGRDVRG